MSRGAPKGAGISTLPCPGVSPREEADLGAPFRQRLDSIRAAVDAATWPARATSNLVLLRELIALAELRQSLVFGMNLRSLAERVNMSTTTVWRSLRRLQARGFLKIGRADRLPLQSTTWRLCCPPKCVKVKQGTSPLHTSLDEKPCFTLTHSRLDIAVAADAWSGPGGKSRFRVWAALQRGPQTALELAETCGLNVRTAQRGLRFLEDLGLAVPDGKTWRTGEKNLEQAAMLLGTAGAGVRRRGRHRLERRAFRENLRWAQERKIRVDHGTGEVLTAPVPRARQLPAVVAYAVRVLAGVGA